MAEYTVTNKLDAEYIRSGIWICEKSPTGAHHWIYVEDGVHVCKYCWGDRKFPMSFGKGNNPFVV